jgi:hypothetical protein
MNVLLVWLTPMVARLSRFVEGVRNITEEKISREGAKED